MSDIQNLFGKALGTVKVTDLPGFQEYLSSYSPDQRQALWSHLYKDCGWGNGQRGELSKQIRTAFEDSFPAHRNWSGIIKDKGDSERRWLRQSAASITEKLTKLCDYAEEFEQPLQYFYHDEVFTAIGCAGKVRYILPSDYVEITPAKSYDDITLAQLRALGCSSDASLVSSDFSTLTTSSIREKISSKESSLQEKKAEMDAVRNCQTDELAAMQAEIDRQMAALKAKQEELLSALQVKMDQLELEKFKMETQIYMLDSEIYSIRCLLGETIRFVKLRTGTPAAPETPLVVFQKVRYLDEELARLSAIYDVDGEFEYIERFFKHSPYTFEFFTPAQRCVSLVRISRTGKTIANSDRPGMQNCLMAYELEHGTCIGIMVRDGDNLWMGWTEEDRVNIQEDMFYTEHTSVEPLKAADRPNFEKSKLALGKEKLLQLKPMVSRVFVFNILQGFIGGEHGIIQFPEPINIVRQVKYRDSPYIIFSAADGWLEDNRYGSMKDILEKCNSSLMEGDMILTTQNISPQNYDRWSGRYVKNNDRGRGYADRTHDCFMRDNTIYPLNLVETINKVMYAYFAETVPHGSSTNQYTMSDGTPYSFRCEVGVPDSLSDADLEQLIEKQKAIHPMCEFVGTENFEETAYYVSVKKKYSLSGTSRSNLRVYRDEFMNLTYFNSVWGEYLLTTRKTEDFRQFANAARYLNTALQFVRRREEEEYRHICAEFPELDRIQDWPAILSEWKLEKKVRSITAYQAKRFARYLKANTPAILS